MSKIISFGRLSFCIQINFHLLYS